jgi:hypothetical protein
MPESREPRGTSANRDREHVEDADQLRGPSDRGARSDPGHTAGAHPEVVRSGRSRSTAIGLVVVLVIAALVYLAVVTGIVGSVS